ncbi:MAG: class I SAM-dependent methyltransferase [Thermoplasmata archaeon]
MAAPRRGVGERLCEALRDPKAAIVGSLFHDRAHPTLIEFYRGSICQTVSPAELLADLLGRPIDLRPYERELEELRRTLDERLGRPMAFRPITRLSEPQSLLLYALARELRPTTVFETGVANGYSSAVLLQALDRNGSGTLWSVDISHEVGALVPEADRLRWRLRILPIRGERRAFANLLAEIGPIDLFEHDSDHGFAFQTFELESVWPRMRGGGILSVDDADWSWATLDFARRAGIPLRTLVTPTRVCGVLRRPPPAA